MSRQQCLACYVLLADLNDERWLMSHEFKHITRGMGA